MNEHVPKPEKINSVVMIDEPLVLSHDSVDKLMAELRKPAVDLSLRADESSAVITHDGVTHPVDLRVVDQKPEPEPKNDPKHRARDLTDREKNALRKWPCDGVRRYTVRKSKVRSTYSEAYEGIFIIEGGHTEPGGGRVFTPGAKKRIRALNENYLAVAHNFVIAALHMENAALETVLEDIEPKPETTPEHGQETPSSPAAG